MNKIEIPKAIFEQIFFQKGGEKKDLYKELTGQKINPVNLDEANAEIEVNEFVKTQGTVKKAGGETHENGGTPVRLEENDRVLSDHLKVGSDLAKALSKEFEIKVKATDTYAKVLDKYLTKIGHKKETEELEKRIEKLDKQKTEVEDEATLALNQEYLSNKINESGKELEKLEPEKDKMFDLLYTAQEVSKEKDKKEESSYGIEGLTSKYNISDEKLEEMVMQNGGGFYERANPYFATNPGGIGKLKEWINSQMYKAEYPLGDINQTAIRLKDLADNAGIEYTSDDFKNIENLNNFAGKLQKNIIDNKPEIAYHYGLNVEPTREGLQYLVDNKKIKPEELGIKLVNGKVARGSYDTLSTEASNRIKEVVAQLPTNSKKKYAITNYNDNLAYFRGVKTKEQELDRNEYDKFLAENKDKSVGSGYFKTDVEGVYVKPKVIGQSKDPNEGTLVTTGQPESLLPPPEVTQNLKRDRMGMLLLPDQNPLSPPSLLAPAKFTPRISGFEYAQISPEQQLTEINRSQTAIQNQLSQLPDAQRAATLASMDANNASQVSKVISDTNRYNAQAKERGDANAAEVRTRQSVADMESAAKYQDLMGRELGAYDVNLQNYYNRLNANQMNNWLTVNELNRGNAFNENIKFTGDGYIYTNPHQFSTVNIQSEENPKKKKSTRFKK